MEDLGTKPSVYYLPPVNRNFKFEDGWESEREKLSEDHSHHH
jgi:molybdopterin-containing oxidoreductase family iron-sulfur binding subunit